MDFFKSVFSDETPESPPSSDPQSQSQSQSPSQSQTLISDTSPKSPFTGGGGGGWNFGGLIQTLTSKSESVLETYRRDLQEFSTGLKNETLTLKHVAATSLDVGAAKAQVSLESVGQAIDSLGSVVSEIIFHQNAADHSSSSQSASFEHQSLPSRDVGVKYSRFEAQLRAIQTEESTYVEDPSEDGERGEFEKWKLGFDLGEYTAEIEELLGRRESGVEVIYDRLVPSVVDRETFWLRYFYKVHRLKQAEFVRARLVKRAIGADDDDEELSWDVDDDDDNGDHDEKKVVNVHGDEGSITKKEENSSVEGSITEKEVEKDGVKQGGDGDEKKDVILHGHSFVGDAVNNESPKEENSSVDGSITEKEAENHVVNEIVEVEEKEGKVEEGKGEVSECSKDSDMSVVSSQPSSHEEEDLGWDEIEDIGSGDDDEKKGPSQLGSPSRAELRKRLSVAEDDEDLSWDIEDDD